MAFASIDELRAARDSALAATDYLMLDDAPFWIIREWLIAYRQELRDLPERAAAEGLENIELPQTYSMLRKPVEPAEEEVTAEAPAEQSASAEENTPSE